MKAVGMKVEGMLRLMRRDYENSWEGKAVLVSCTLLLLHVYDALYCSLLAA